MKKRLRILLIIPILFVSYFYLFPGTENQFRIYNKSNRNLFVFCKTGGSKSHNFIIEPNKNVHLANYDALFYSLFDA